MWGSKVNEVNDIVYSKLNPYFYTDTQIEVTSVEQITIYHKKINEERILGEFLKDKKYSKFRRRRVLKAVLKLWDKEFKTSTANQKKELIDKSANYKRRKIKKIDEASIYTFGVICVIGIFLIQKYTFLSNIKFNEFLNRPLYNNLILLIIYLSLIGCLYMIIIKTYFEATKNVGNNAKKFIESEFRKIKRKYKIQHRELKIHLLKYVNVNVYKNKYKFKKIYDPNVVISRLENYIRYIEDKIAMFSKYYYVIVIFSHLFKISVLGLVVYLSIIYIDFLN